MSTYRKFLTLTTSFLMLVGVTCNSRAAQLFEFYDACRCFFDGSQEVFSEPGKALKAKDPYLGTLDNESILILRVISSEINKSEARKDNHYTSLVEYFISYGTRGSAEGGGINIEVMAKRNRSGVCRGIDAPTLEEIRNDMVSDLKHVLADSDVNNELARIAQKMQVNDHSKRLAQSQSSQTHSYMASYPEQKKRKQSECCVVL